MRLDDVATLSRRVGEKWSSAPAGVLPAWVADMDFPIAPPVREAMIRRIDTDLGYPAWYDESGGGPLGEVFAARMLREFGFAANPAHVRLFTDVNQAMQVALHLGTDPGDAVVLHAPVCPPFTDVLHHMRRPPTTVPMRLSHGRWDPNLDELACRLRTARVLFLVNPHNPTGHVLRRDELEKLAALVVEQDVLVISDEVHADLVYEGFRHIPFASLSDEVAKRTVTITSASKAFNLAGLRCAVAHIGVPAIRDAVDAHRGVLFGQVGALGVEAVKAAWTYGDPWLNEVRSLLARNRHALTRLTAAGIGYVPPDATYLAWLDCTSLGLGADPSAFFQSEAKVMLFRGSEFGPAGAGFARMNFATPPPVLDELVSRMLAASGT